MTCYLLYLEKDTKASLTNPLLPASACQNTFLGDFCFFFPLLIFLIVTILLSEAAITAAAGTLCGWKTSLV